MQKRLQQTDDDTVLEITDTKPVKVRLSQKSLLRRKQYLEQAIEQFQNELREVQKALDMITTEQNAQKR